MPDSGRNDKPREVLILADSDAELDGLDKILVEAGYKVFRGQPDESSLSAVAQAPPGLVVGCPKPGDARIIRFVEALADRLGSVAPNTIVVTDVDDEKMLKRLLAAGVRDVLSKPLLPVLVRVKAAQFFRATQPQESIGGYEIRRLIGSGGMASVYLAAKDGREVAMKVLHATQAEADPENLARFRREAEILKLLEGQGAPRFHELGRTKVDFYYVMELLRGETLRVRLDRLGALKPREVARFLIDIATALDAIHSRRIVHRDVKPSNIMITLTGSAKLIDFGLAKDTTDFTLTSSNIVLGTPSYMAPELANGQPSSAATDAFALGMTAFEAVLGYSPEKAPPYKIFADHTNGVIPDPATFLPKLDPRLLEVFKGLLAVKPESRLSLRDVVRRLDTGSSWFPK